MRDLATILIIIGLIIIVGGLLIRNAGGYGTIGEEVAKIGLQVAILSVVTLLIQGAVRDAQTRQENQQRDNETRLDLLRRLRTAYSTIKEIRGQLQVLGWQMASTAPMRLEDATTYRDTYRVLMDEIRKDELKSGLGEGPETNQITKCLDKMEHYLGTTIRNEYKIYMTANPPPATPFSSPIMQDFIKDKSPEVGKHLSRPYHAALSVLQDAIHGRTEQLATTPRQDFLTYCNQEGTAE